MLTRKQAQDIISTALKDASSTAGVSFYERYVPTRRGGSYIYLMPNHRGSASQEQTFGGPRQLVVNYEFDVGILCEVSSENQKAIEQAESDCDSILSVVIARVLQAPELYISDEEFYIGKAETGRSVAAANIKVKVRDVNG